MRAFALVLVALTAIFGAHPALACGATSNCKIGDRFYRIRMPANIQEGQTVGAVVFAHGYQGTAAGVMRNKRLKRVAERLGVALIAVKSSRQDWALPGAPSGGPKPGFDELRYFDAVVADATARFPINPSQMMVTGFSAGGMMVWHLICHRSELFAAFAPMAGTFWKPEPATCDTPPTSVVHIHGDKDKTVPLGGRAIGAAHQGDVPTVIKMYANYGDFGPAEKRKEGKMTCEVRVNANDKLFKYCLFPGRHNFSSEYVALAWNTFVEHGDLARRSP
jgi:polyhydroxybutyrate depolymerase